MLPLWLLALPLAAATLDLESGYLQRNPGMKKGYQEVTAATEEAARLGSALQALRTEYETSPTPQEHAARRAEARAALAAALDRLRERKKAFEVYSNTVFATAVIGALHKPEQAEEPGEASRVYTAFGDAAFAARVHIQTWETVLLQDEASYPAAVAKAARVKTRRRLQAGGGVLAAVLVWAGTSLWRRRRKAALLLPFDGYGPAGPARPWTYGVQYPAAGPNPAALKLLSPEFSGTGAEAALTAARLKQACAFRHPGVVAFLAAGVAPEGVFLVTEPEAGRPLSGPLGAPEPMGAARALAALLPVARTLDAAHRAGFAHGALSPSNILLGPDGAGRLTDFGVARALAARVGTRALSPVYSAPEQREGEAKLPSDLYAFGVVLYEALFGRPPFEGQNLVALKEEGRFPKPSALWGRPAPEADALFAGLLEPKARARRPPPGGLEAALAAVRF